jgi:hypothetical protein
LTSLEINSFNLSPCTGSENRCLRISAPGVWSVAVPHQSSGLADNFRDKKGTVGGRVSRDLVYTQLSRRGEVAEWLKAMVC